MSIDLPRMMPSRFAAGTTVSYQPYYEQFDSGSWTLQVFLAGPAVANTSAVSNGSGFTVTFTATQTSGLVPGTYYYTERVSNAATGEVYDAYRGAVEVTQNLATAAAGDTLTWEEKTLAVIEGVLSGRVTDDIESYTIEGRQVTRIPFTELRAMRAQLKALVQIQRNGGKFGQPILVSFPGFGPGEIQPTTDGSGEYIK